MGDGVVTSREPAERAVEKIEDWYTYHFRNLNYLGMNTFAKDLLEFGAPQHWDVKNGAWYYQSKFPEVWGNILPIATEHGLEVLPYYEYAGSSGKQGLAKESKKTTGPLSGEGPYTHIKWAETKRVDLTDPIVLEEFLRVIDLTIVQHKDEATFVGAWIRPRISQMPISFADPTRQRFADEANGGQEVSREDLQADSALLAKYKDWWEGKRREFLSAVRNHLKEKGVGSDPIVLFMPWHAEPAPSFVHNKGPNIPIVTDDVDFWTSVTKEDFEDYDQLLVESETDILENHRYLEALRAPTSTWGVWEWNHAAPRPDPAKYKDAEGVLISYPFNRMFTVNDPDALEAFRGTSGLALIRHYPLNEKTMGENLGYFVTDVDRPGSYGMLSEALAVANGDPWYIGYTSGHIYNRPFPDAVRRFNANYLALPALPSTRLADSASDAEVVVRHIDAGQHGSYFAIVNTGMQPKENVSIRLPKSGQIVEAATKNELSPNADTVTVSLEPFELRTLHVQ